MRYPQPSETDQASEHNLGNSFEADLNSASSDV